MNRAAMSARFIVFNCLRRVWLENDWCFLCSWSLIVVPVNELAECVAPDQRVGILVAFGFLASAFPPCCTVVDEGKISLWNRGCLYD